MNRIGNVMIVVFLFLAGSAFLFISHADRGDTLPGLATWNKNHPKEIPTEGGHAMVNLPIGEVRKKGLPMGLWGGQHISMEVTAQGATIEYDCAHATISQRITLDGRGRFEVPGMQIPEHGGPVRQNEQSTGSPVRFAGQVNGKRLKLSVRSNVTKELVGIFTLVYGSEAKLMKCK